MACSQRAGGVDWSVRLPFSSRTIQGMKSGPVEESSTGDSSSSGSGLGFRDFLGLVANEILKLIEGGEGCDGASEDLIVQKLRRAREVKWSDENAVDAAAIAAAAAIVMLF